MKYVSGNNIFITFATKSINMTLQKNLQNMNDIKSSVYAQKVELLLRLIPIVMDEGCLPYMVVQP